MKEYILTINPGSTSTKMAVYKGEEEVFTVSTSHSSEEIGKYAKVSDQEEFRRNTILSELEKRDISLTSFKAVVGRGGLLRPIPSGAYEVNDKMISDLREGARGEHASNLGGLLADAIAKSSGCKAFIADPVVVDELEEVARVSGHPDLPRLSIFHALNHKAIARQTAKKLNKRYEDLNLIVAHMGGGVSVGIHEKGKVVDVNNALDGEGPFSPERSGGLPAGQLLKKACVEGVSYDVLKKQLTGKGGFVAYFGTNDGRKISEMAEKGDSKAKLILDALAYQVAKEIGLLATVVSGKVDAISLTGGLAHDKLLTKEIERRVNFIAPVHLFPGEDELAALRDAALAVLNDEQPAKVY